MRTFAGVKKAAVLGLASVAWGCGAVDGSEEADTEENLGTSREAIVATGYGVAYLEQCLANGVPAPPPFGQSTVLSEGTYEYGKWTRGGATTFSYNDIDAGEVYTSQSVLPGQSGLCVILAHFGGANGGLFDVICQGETGKACFWEGTKPPQPPATSFGIVTLDGGTKLATNNHAVCTNCHAGKNAFIAHHGVFDDGLNGENDPWHMHDGWMPSVSWYTPIVPAGWPENPASSSVGYPSSCTGCHSTSGLGGALPPLRNPAFAGGNFCKILDEVMRRPPALGGMPPASSQIPGSPCSADDAADCPANNNPEVQAMLAACGKPQPSMAASTKNSPVALKGTSISSPYQGTWDHVFVGSDVNSSEKAYLFDNLMSSSGTMNGWGVGDYTSTMKSIYRTTAWLRDGDGSKLSIAVTDFNAQVWERQFGAGGASRAVSSSVLAAGAPFGYVRHDGKSAVVFRGNDNYIYESLWNNSSWTTAIIPGQALKAFGDPVAYNRGATSSVIYKCGDLLCELRRGASWQFRTIRQAQPLKGTTMPAVLKRSASNEYLIFYAATDGLHMISDAETGFQHLQFPNDALISSSLITSAPAPYVAQDGGIRVAFIADQGTGSVSELKEAVRPNGSTAWSTTSLQTTNNNNQQLAQDPTAYVSSMSRNTIVFRNTANTIYQLQATTSGSGAVSYARTTIQKGFNTDTSGTLTAAQERHFSLWLPPGQYKFDLTVSSGDSDLYVKRGDTPSQTVYDCRPYLGALQSESCISTIPGPGHGYINVMVRGYSASSAYTLRGYFND